MYTRSVNEVKRIRGSSYLLGAGVIVTVVAGIVIVEPEITITSGIQRQNR